MTDQLAVTIVADVKPRRRASLKRLLTIMGEDAAGNEVLPLGELSTAHFARLMMLDATKDLDGNPLPAHLIYMSDVDGSLEDHLEELVDLAPKGLDQILEHCQGYPARNAATRDTRLAYLTDRAVKAGAMYVNTVGRTLRQVQDEAGLREAIQVFLDSGDFDGVEPEAVRDAIRRFVQAREDLRWATEPPPAPGPLERAADLVGALGLPLELAA
ncbi:MAG: hypothetical protein M3071_20485, partial [Actinomycetota bacterium]|nr:hypothetical protein [Actinomycetota bacterium]